MAKQSFEVAGKTPIPLRAAVQRNVDRAVAPVHGVAAVITDSRGQALWETRVPIRALTLGNQKKVQLVLRPAERPKAPPEPTSIALECEGARFHVDLSPTSATVVLPNSTVILPLHQGRFRQAILRRIDDARRARVCGVLPTGWTGLPAIAR